MKHISEFLKNSLPEHRPSQSEGKTSSMPSGNVSSIPAGTTRGNLKAKGTIHTAPGNFATWFLSHLRRIGAEKTLLSDNQDENVRVVNAYYQDLVINNPYFPNNYPYVNVLDAFGDAVVYGKIKLMGHNIKTHIEAFRDFMSEYGHKYRDPQEMRQDRYLPQHGGSLNVDKQLQMMYGKDIPPIFHKYITDKSIIQ